MTPLQTCEAAIDACNDRTDASINTCLDILRPILTPYFEQDGFEKRFERVFRSMMRIPISSLDNVKDRIKAEVAETLSGPTYAEAVAKQRADREAEKQALLDQMVAHEKQFVSTLLTKLGLRKGDHLMVIGENSFTPTHISLEQWDLPDERTLPRYAQPSKDSDGESSDG